MSVDDHELKRRLGALESEAALQPDHARHIMERLRIARTVREIATLELHVPAWIARTLTSAPADGEQAQSQQ